MPRFSMESFERAGIDLPKFDPPKFDLTEKFQRFNENFISRIKAENGVFGKIDEQIKRGLINEEFNKEFKKAEDFIKRPEHILGNEKTKFGEIAEQMEVAIRNAYRIVDGKRPNATSDVPRTGPIDIMIDGIPIQMKFYNGAGDRTLGAIIESLDKGAQYAKNIFMIPKDQYATLKKIINHFELHKNLGSLQIEVNGSYLRHSSLQRMLNKIHEIEKRTGKKFSDAVKPAATGYAEVQLGAAKDTLKAKKAAALNALTPKNLKLSHRLGLNAGLTSAGITAAISTADSIRLCWNGAITPREAFVDIAKDTAAAGAVGYGSEFINSAVGSLMKRSGHALLKTLGNANVAAAAISFGISSFDSVIDYTQDTISGLELAYNLGKNAAGVAGTMGGASLGAAIGSPIPVVGNVAGGLVGGMIGYAVTTGAYATAIKLAESGVDKMAAYRDNLKAAVKKSGANVITEIAALAPNALSDVKKGMNDFAASVNAPIHF